MATGDKLKKETEEFCREAIKNMRKHGYKKLSEETEEYKHKRLAHNKRMKMWRFMLKAVKEYENA